MKTLSIRNSMSRSPCRLAFLLIPLVLTCFALSPDARAVCRKGCDSNFNTFLGDNALNTTTTGTNNVAIGGNALVSNTSGASNTAVGAGANESNATGNDNTAVGFEALASNQPGSNNTAVGHGALVLNFTGNNNIALGFSAGGSLTTGNDNIDVGNAGVAGESGIMRIGTAGTQTATFIAGITGTPITGVAVGVTADGQLGVRGSSVRFKEAIKPMDKQSEAILALQPVAFRYKKELDPKGTPQFGLVAEEVEKVNPTLVTRDAQGKAFTVRYEEINAMLLNEFLKEHRKVEAQDCMLQEQQKQIEKLTAQLKEQAEQIRKVNDKVEMNRPAPQMVVNDR
jgi:hypothetical protein